MLYGVPVRRLQAEIDSAEFAELCAFLSLEPQGGMRLDYWMARVLAWLAALGGQRQRPAECLPEWWGTKPRAVADTPDSMAAVFEAFAHAHNASLTP